ncbi:hypothetical protein [Azospirillum sp. A39]|uniref:hypothetical protein n=1 Tax=Azospirillum sp. A39 TaxID=3462279 RepID=UPI004045AF1D
MSRKATPQTGDATVAASTPPAGANARDTAEEKGRRDATPAAPQDAAAGEPAPPVAANPPPSDAEFILQPLAELADLLAPRLGRGGAFPDAGVAIPPEAFASLAAVLGERAEALLAGRAYRDRVVGVTRDGRKVIVVVAP